MTSGLSSRSGSPGMSPMPSPPSTSTIGYGTRIRSASRTSPAAASSSANRNSISDKGGHPTIGPVTERLTEPVHAADHVRGEAGADLELVMYGDFECPYCTASQGILARVERRLAGRLRFVFRHFPVDGVHPHAREAAEAAEAAAAQGAFWEMHDALYGARGHLATDDLVRAARELGLDGDRVAAEVGSGAHAARV